MPETLDRSVGSGPSLQAFMNAFRALSDTLSARRVAEMVQPSKIRTFMFPYVLSEVV